jgi:hypothetical protein
MLAIQVFFQLFEILKFWWETSNIVIEINILKNLPGGK